MRRCASRFVKRLKVHQITRTIKYTSHPGGAGCQLIKGSCSRVASRASFLFSFVLRPGERSPDRDSFVFRTDEQSAIDMMSGSERLLALKSVDKSAQTHIAHQFACTRDEERFRLIASSWSHARDARKAHLVKMITKASCVKSTERSILPRTRG